MARGHRQSCGIDGIELEFSIDHAEDRLNSFRKIDTLVSATAFHEGLAAEAALRRQRGRQGRRVEQRASESAATEVRCVSTQFWRTDRLIREPVARIVRLA
jgi:hypothetical protein